MASIARNIPPARRAAQWAVLALAAGAVSVVAAGCWLKSDGSGPANLKRCGLATDCPATGDVCSYPTCSTEGICGTAPVTDGISPTQTVGDCLLAKCIAGVTTQVPDASDVDDQNPCTTDDCATTPPHTPVADGTACMLGTSVGTCSAGTCEIPCNAGKPCDDMNPCTTDSCDESTRLCTFAAFTGDAPIADPDPHDCKKPYCSAGALTSTPNDTEIPDDNNACTTDTCVGGQPMHANVASGMSPTGCNVPQKCDGNGNCVNCTVAADCGAPTECSSPVCQANGTCDPGYLPMGTVVATQTPMDCQKRVCSGSQATAITVPDPTDTQNDMNECTADTCVGTTPTHTITPGASCMTTKFCSAAGACVDCYVTANCAPGNHCENPGVCYSCSNGTKDPGETGIDCGNATCGNCAGVACGAGCHTGLSCVDATCCTAASCADCSSCNNAMGTCQPVPNGTNDGACVLPAKCQGGVCLKGPGQTCSLGSECLSGVCTTGACT